jgi:hypothetical protein
LSSTPTPLLELDPSASFHRAEQVARHRFELFGLRKSMFEHSLEHLVGQKVHVFGKHAEDQAARFPRGADHF